MDKKESITYEMLEKQLNTLIALLDRYEGDDACLFAERVCFEVVNSTCNSFYEGMGIFQEAGLQYKRVVEEVDAEHEDDEDYMCDDCKRKLEEQEKSDEEEDNDPQNGNPHNNNGGKDKRGIN
jgi:hypothetical protein